MVLGRHLTLCTVHVRRPGLGCFHGLIRVLAPFFGCLDHAGAVSVIVQTLGKLTCS